jgi:hypothetical protein
MPAANPLADTVLYNTGRTSGMNAGTTQAPASFTSGANSTVAGSSAGNANVTVAALVAISLAVLLGFHLLGFRFAFDVAVGRRG